MSYTLTGRIVHIGATETVGTSQFEKRQIVIEQSGQYPQQIAMELVKDKCSLADSFKIGDTVEVSFDLRGREYNGKYYTNLNCWKINRSQHNGSDTTAF